MIFYVGYSSIDFNNNYGSELALINLATHFSEYYDVSVFGKNINSMKIGNISFFNSNILESVFNHEEIDVCIISRYVHYLIEFPLKAKKTYIWLHDVCYHGAYNGFMLPDNGKILVENSLHQINGIVTLTEWHKNNVMNLYKLTPNKLRIIGNGIK